jgi:hypothetical protein
MNRPDIQMRTDVASAAMGLNDNLNFLGKELHVQTENVQSSVPCILTQVFLHGRVIHTTKYEYAAELAGSSDLVKIRELMCRQHTKVMDRINQQQAKYQQRS